MPSSRSLSRRDALAALGSAATVSAAGCLGFTYAPNAYCQVKAVNAVWIHEGTRHGDEVVRSSGYVEADGDGGEVDTDVAEELSSLAPTVREVAVDDDAAAALDRTFAEVHYLLGFCGDAFSHGCRNTAAASREAFNAVQVGDRAQVTLSDDVFSVHSVERATVTDDWTVDYRQFDFSERHADYGVPLTD